MTPNTGTFLDRVHALATIARASGGAAKSLISTEWNIAGDCREPVPRQVWGRPSRSQWSSTILVDPGKTSNPHYVDLWVRCRRCDPCRELRRKSWAFRAKAETSVAARTWFGTLTFDPEQQYRALCKAREEELLQGGDFDTLTFKEQFCARHAVLGAEVTKYLKRIRKESCAPLRNLTVAEYHQSGLPHYHLLVHECDADRPVKHATLRGQWLLGFCRWSLVDDPLQSTYLCKYLSKSTAARVRASVRYGLDVLKHSWIFGQKNPKWAPDPIHPREYPGAVRRRNIELDPLFGWIVDRIETDHGDKIPF